MREANIYILGSTLWVKTFPKILESIVAKGIKVQIACDNEAASNELDDLLWTYEQLSFLPHALYTDPQQDQHPIIISSKDERFINADVIALTGQKVPSNIIDYKKAMIVYDPKDSSAKDVIQKQISELASKEFKIRYFKQTPSGSWESASGLVG